MLGHHSRLLCIAGLLPQCSSERASRPAATPEPYDPWPGLVRTSSQSCDDDGAGVIAIEMPVPRRGRGERSRHRWRDASTRRHQGVLAITLVIDQNPAPMAARFELGRILRCRNLDARTRQQYTDVHRVAELSDGKLTWQNLREGFRRLLGSGRQERLRGERQARPNAFQAVRQAERGSNERRPRSPDQIGHPNNSACRWTRSRCFMFLAFFVNELRLWQDDNLVLAIEGGISIRKSNIRFTYVPNGAKRLPLSRPRTLRATCSRTNGRPTVPGFDAARYRPVAGAIANTRGSETSHLPLPPGLVAGRERGVGLLRRAELPTEISLYLRHAQHGFGPLVSVIG